MSILILIVLGIITVVGIYLLILKKKINGWDLSDIRLWFAIFFLLYGITFLLFESDIEISEKILIKSGLIYFLSAIGLLASIFFTKNQINEHYKEVYTNWNILYTLRLIAIGGILAGIILLVYRYEGVGEGGIIEALKMSRAERGSLITARINFPYMHIFIISLSTYFFTLLHWPKRNPKLAYLFFILVAFGLLSFWGIVGRRKWMLFLILSLLVILSSRYRLGVNTRTVSLFLLIALIFLFIGYTRGLYPKIITSGDIDILFSYMKSHFTYNWIIPREFQNIYATLIASVKGMTESNANLLLGRSYISAIPHLVPETLYPGKKPLNLAREFSIIGEKWWPEYPGELLGFSMITEAYLNFGWIGPPIMIFFVGIGLNKIVKLKTKGIYGYLLYAPLIGLAFKINRADFAGVVQLAFWYWILVTSMWMTALLFLGAAKKNAKRRFHDKKEIANE